MTLNTFQASFKKNLTRVLQASLVLTAAATLLSPLAANAETRTEYTVGASETKTLFVYVKYGSDNSNVNATNIAASAVINNPTDSNIRPSFLFDKVSNFDVFYGDPANQTDTPQSPRECESFVNTAPQNIKYQIPSSFVTDTKINSYGLQTAKNGAQDKSTLIKNHAGCLVLALKLAPGAKADDRAQLVVNLDALGSPDYTADTRPEIVTVPLRVIAATTQVNVNSTSNTTTSIKAGTAGTTSSASTSPATTARSGGLDFLPGVGILVFLVGSGFMLKKFAKKQIKID